VYRRQLKLHGFLTKVSGQFHASAVLFPAPQWRGGLVGPRVDLAAVAKRKISVPAGNRIPVVRPIASAVLCYLCSLCSDISTATHISTGLQDAHAWVFPAPFPHPVHMVELPGRHTTYASPHQIRKRPKRMNQNKENDARKVHLSSLTTSNSVQNRLCGFILSQGEMNYL